MKIRTADAILAATSLVVSLACAECGLRIADWPKTTAGWKVASFVATRDASELNELGFRGHRADGPVDEAIVLLGDSQVESVGAFAEMPEVPLAKELGAKRGDRVRVVSIGAAGWGQDQELAALRDALPKMSPKPKLVAVWLTPFNDFWNNTFPTHYGRSKPTYWLDGDKLTGPSVGWLERCNRRALYLVRAAEAVAGVAPCESDDDWEARLPPPYADLGSSAGPAVELVDLEARLRGLTPKEVAYQIRGDNFRNEKTHYDISFAPRSPRLAYSIRLTRLLLLEIQALCRENGAGFAVFMSENSSRYFPEQPAIVRFQGMVVRISRQAVEDVVADTVSGVPFLAVRLAEDHSVSREDSHLNGEGNRLVMAELARWLLDRGALPQK